MAAGARQSARVYSGLRGGDVDTRVDDLADLIFFIEEENKFAIRSRVGVDHAGFCWIGSRGFRIFKAGSFDFLWLSEERLDIRWRPSKVFTQHRVVVCGWRG